MAFLPSSPSVESFSSTESVSIPATVASKTSSLPGSDAGGSPASNSELDAHAQPCDDGRGQVPDRASKLFYLSDGNVQFELDDGTLYKVHRYFFDKHCPTFAAQYLQDGVQDVVKLLGVRSVDFDRFLAMIYPSELGQCDIHTVDEWTSILRLATKWSMPALRALAIREIEPQASPVDKVVIAREFSLGETWLAPAFTAICDAPKWIEYEDAQRLGLRTVVEIGRIREERPRGKAQKKSDVSTAVLASDVLFSVVETGRPTFLHEAQTPHTFTSTETASKPVTLRAALNHDSSSAEHAQPGSSAAFPAILEARAEGKTASTILGGNCLSSCDSRLEKISDQLEYLALRAQEKWEEKDLCSTSVGGALYAFELADRMVREASPAAVRHREWRQRRLERYCDGLEPLSAIGEATYVLDFQDSNYTRISEIDERIAQLLLSNAMQEPSCNETDTSLQRKYLTVVLYSAYVKAQTQLELERRSLVVTEDDDPNKMHILIPYPPSSRPDAEASDSSL